MTPRALLFLPVLLLVLAWTQVTFAQQTAPASTTVSVSAPANAPAAAPPAKTFSSYPLWVMVAGIVTVLGLIIFVKTNAFIALITAAMVVSVLSPGDWSDKMARVARAFGESTGKIGIVIALASVIGKCMLDSGAADRIVRSFLRVFGEKQSSVALMGSGFVLGIPVFFDTVFYLLVPLARSLHKSTGRNYLKYLLAIVAGGAITHTLVPPTPGPLTMAAQLHVDVGLMILIGGLVALPAAAVGLIFAGVADRIMPIPMRPLVGEVESEPLRDDQLPGLFVSLIPVLLPVLLISGNTALATMTSGAARTLLGEAAAKSLTPDVLQALSAQGHATLVTWYNWSALLGDANFALLASAVVSLWLVFRQRKLTLTELGEVTEVSLMSGGVIILITAGGGAFGAMLRVAQVGDSIQALFTSAQSSGLAVLLLGFSVSALLKVAQGSSTVAMIAGSAMLGDLAKAELLGFNPVYLATAIGGGSLIGSWMNDSGFWVFAKMGAVTEGESLKSWSILLCVLGVTSLVVTILLTRVMPLI